MNKMQLFTHEQFGSVRIIEEDGKVLFCGSDVAKALGYENPRKAVRDHCPHGTKRSIRVMTGKKVDGTPAMQNVEMTFIPEGDLYRLIAHSKLPSAEKFESWVFDEVLPTIRKTGGYVANEDMFVDTYFRNVDENEKAILRILLKNNASMADELEAAKPKVPYYDSILSAPNAVSVTTIAKDYGMSAKVLNEFLHQLGIQYKRGGTWMLYQKYADKGYTRTETVYLPQSNRAQINMKWTQKGRMFIYEQMKKVGMLPVCEKEVA